MLPRLSALRRSLPLLLASSVCGWPAAALAREPGELSLSASVQAFYGDLPGTDGAFDLNPYGPGLGVRGAVTLPASIYLALSYEHFFGGAPTDWANTVSVQNEATIDQVTAWGGYQLDFDGATLRPCLGLGYAYAIKTDTVTDSGVVRHERESDGYLILTPGLAFATPVGPASFIVEGRYSFLPETLAVADALLIGIGVGMEF
jgi:hypothetical protein